MTSTTTSGTHGSGKNSNGSAFDGVLVSLAGKGYTTSVRARGHDFKADEPPEAGGKNEGPTPYDLLLAGLGACKAMTVKMYADRKGWPLKEVLCTLRHDRRHPEDCEDCEEKGNAAKIDHIDVELQFIGDLTDEQRARLKEISNKCPVHKTITSDLIVNSKMVDEG